MKKLVVTVVSLVLFAGAVNAGPLVESEIASDAKWIAHMDCSVFKGTELGRFMLSKLNDDVEALEGLDEFAAKCGFNPATDIDSISLYGTGGENGVMLIKGSYDADKLLAVAGEDKSHESITYKKYTIHTWDKKKHRKHGKNNAAKGKDYGCLYENILVFADSRNLMETALSVLDGSASGLDSDAMFKNLPSGAAPYMIAVADMTAMEKVHPSAAVLKQTDNFALTVSESAGSITTFVNMEMKDAESAQNVKAMVQGMLAFGAMQNKDAGCPDLMEIIKINVNDNLMNITAGYPVADIITKIEECEAKEKACSEAK